MPTTMTPSEWQNILNLRKTRCNYSGWSYTYEWAKANKFVKPWRSESWIGGHNISIPEPIEIRLNEDKSIDYRKIKPGYEKTRHNYRTKFGKFYSNDMGEFGGELITPSGVSLSGNFCQIFDYDGKVYAIDSVNHMGLGHFKLYKFSDATHYRCLYKVGGWGNKRSNESLDLGAFYLATKGIYILINGNILIKDDDTGEILNHRSISRLLFVSGNTVKEYLEIGEIFSDVQNIIVQDNILYVAADKILAIVDITNGKANFYTFLSKGAVHNLRKAHATFLKELNGLTNQ